MGHQVHVVATRVHHVHDFVDGKVWVHNRPIKFVRIASKLFPAWIESVQLGIVLVILHRKYHFSRIEIPNWEGLGAIPILLRLPVALRHHTSTEDSLEAQGLPMTRPQRALAKLEHLACRWAKINIVHSKYYAKKLANLGNVRGVCVVPHFLPPVRQPKFAEPSSKTILCVGALMARKGTDVMFDAAEIFLRELPEWKLILVGLDRDGFYERAFRLRADPDVASRVIFEGFLGEDELADRYLQCGIYLTTSLFESFGLPCLEAMMRGKPLVATNAGALPELVQHGINGFLFSPKDHEAAAEFVVKLGQDKELRRVMGMRSLEIAKQHPDMNEVCLRYERLTSTLGSKGMVTDHRV